MQYAPSPSKFSRRQSSSGCSTRLSSSSSHSGQNVCEEEEPGIGSSETVEAEDPIWEDNQLMRRPLLTSSSKLKIQLNRWNLTKIFLNFHWNKYQLCNSIFDKIQSSIILCLIAVHMLSVNAIQFKSTLAQNYQKLYEEFFSKGDN